MSDSKHIHVYLTEVEDLPDNTNPLMPAKAGYLSDCNCGLMFTTMTKNRLHVLSVYNVAVW